MTFLLNKSEKAIQKAAMEFAKGEFDKDAARELDKLAQFPEAIWKKAAELGFIGIHLPEKYSGGGMGHLENVLVAETFARTDSTTGAAVMLAGAPAQWLARFGSEEQKTSLLAGMLEGRLRSGVCFARPVSHTRDGFVKIQEVERGVSWQINGRLDSVINAKETHLVFMLCANPSDSEKPEGVSMLVAEAENPGLRMEKNHDMLGLRMTGTSRLNFEAVDIRACGRQKP